MGKFLIYILFGVSAVFMAMSGCNTSGCVDMRSSTPRADFMSSETQRGISLDSLEVTGIGAPGDSVLYTESQRLTSIYLPMPPDVNAVSWRIAYMQSELAAYGIADTISYSFERSPWFAGEDCGAMYRYRIKTLSYTTNLIDSVTIVDSLVVNIDQPTFNIYFRTE